ncbi:MAG: T9SS type A sorting domain-containing protein [Bacteroidia bacterium]
MDEICVSSDSGTCELANSTEEQNPLINISTYPNPAKNKLNIVTPFNSKNSTIKIYNSIGMLVIDEKITSNTINVGELSDGMYILKLYHNNEIYSSKFLISK